MSDNISFTFEQESNSKILFLDTKKFQRNTSLY